MQKLKTEFENSLKSYLINDLLPQRIAVAVSGGIDSTALLHLLANYRESAELDTLEVHILHVNHQLRPESDEEEEFVRQLAESYGKKFAVQFDCYRWNSDNIESSIQESAREARYKYMTRYCHLHDIRILLTAHHRDDHIENYLFRKERASGPLGLSVSDQTYMHDIRILRPLSNIYKSELIAYMQEKGQKWCEDASNNDGKYTRNRIRMELAALSASDKEQIELEMDRDSARAKEISQYLVIALAEIVQFSTHGEAMLDLNAITETDDDVLIPLLSHVLNMVSGLTNLVRYRNLKKLIRDIRTSKGQKGAIDRTLHCCRLRQLGEYLCLSKEIAHIRKDPISLEQGVLWDDRFQFNYDEGYGNSGTIEGGNYVIEALSKETYRTLQKAGAFNMVVENKNLSSDDNISCKIVDIIDSAFRNFSHKDTIFTFPIVKKIEKVVAMPHIFYYDDEDLRKNLRVTFSPRYISRHTHY